MTHIGWLHIRLAPNQPIVHPVASKHHCCFLHHFSYYCDKFCACFNWCCALFSSQIKAICVKADFTLHIGSVHICIGIIFSVTHWIFHKTNTLNADALWKTLVCTSNRSAWTVDRAVITTRSWNTTAVEMDQIGLSGEIVKVAWKRVTNRRVKECKHMVGKK